MSFMNVSIMSNQHFSSTTYLTQSHRSILCPHFPRREGDFKSHEQRISYTSEHHPMLPKLLVPWLAAAPRVALGAAAAATARFYGTGKTIAPCHLRIPPIDLIVI